MTLTFERSLEHLHWSEYVTVLANIDIIAFGIHKNFVVVSSLPLNGCSYKFLYAKFCTLHVGLI